jgi:hypothetical protein
MKARDDGTIKGQSRMSSPFNSAPPSLGVTIRSWLVLLTGSLILKG